MRIPEQQDFAKLTQWGHIADPLAAVRDHTDRKAELRWKNDRHEQAHREYKDSRAEGLGKGSQDFYKEMDRPIDRTKWEYLKFRKAWFNCPLGWGAFASPNTSRILDLGCGDGDVTQRIADYVAGTWQQADYDGFPLEIVGVDINESRVENARKLTRSPHPKITLSFEVGDAVEGLDYAEDFFDYVATTGVFEILDDPTFEAILDEIDRLSADGLYVQDLLDQYPGGHPRPDLAERLEGTGFEVRRREKVLAEPFVESGTMDPLEVWPMWECQVLFAERESPVPFADRW